MLAGLAVFCATATASPGPIETEFDNTEILVELPEPALTAPAAPDSPEQLAGLVRRQIDRARSSGDPRFLGYAEGAFQQWQGDMTGRLLVLRATLEQSLHRFDNARNDLDTVITGTGDPQQKTQAILLLANMETVQGRYDAAETHCRQLQQRYPGLIADSCLAQLRARTGSPRKAYQALKRQTSSAKADITNRLWAEGTLGDIAAQLGMPEAAEHWRAVLSVSPDDLYTRAQLADWHLGQNQTDTTLSLTEGYEKVDSLAVLRAIAMVRSGHPNASIMVENLRERFAEARWRGNLLHQRDMARFYLDIENDTSTALEYARGNWRTQREPLDTRLLLRTALATGDNQLAQEVRSWLDKHRQTDARYPEAES
ncbi:hypothetical protein QPM17_17010 [Marinobacter sp. TBZ242]|uniref:Tetratricopeptide repeat protein n=1 Tax=Marinobacter azerbaijanicus TaxID=3050455 RepID=A0ABT7IFB6_9GAMM|nr:hypothetical protein [Marinobacter sp. TBZ242]MDL0432846.1 hypothetical protein [Marinobacter sp. TBZ242]